MPAIFNKPATFTKSATFTQTARTAQTQTFGSRTDLPVRHKTFPAKPMDAKSMDAKTKAPKRVPIQNRVRVLLVHIPIFSIRGQARLAEDVGVSRSTISRLVGGRINPSYRLARAVTDALEKRLGRPLDIRDVFSTDGTYPTPSGCALCRCGGCLPEAAWGDDGVLKREWKGARPGDWSLARTAETDPQVEPDPPTYLVPRTGKIAAEQKSAVTREQKIVATRKMTATGKERR